MPDTINAQVVPPASPLKRTERPNTVAGLLAKRRQLKALRDELDAQLRRVVCDIDHLDAAIRLFDPATVPTAVARYLTKHRAQKGHVMRFVLSRLREAAGGPLTSRELTEAWIEARGLRTDDDTFCVLRKRIGSCLIKLRADGLVRNGQGRGGYVGYQLADQ